MVLYHGSKEIVEYPEIRKARFQKDFYELVSEELYPEEMGLKMDIEEGIGVFW